MVTTVGNTVLYNWNLLRVELKCNTHKWQIHEVVNVLTTGEICSQYMHISNHDVHFKDLTVLSIRPQ